MYISAALRSISFLEYVISPWAAVISLRSQFGSSNTCPYGDHNYNTYDSNIMQLYEQVDQQGSHIYFDSPGHFLVFKEQDSANVQNDDEHIKQAHHYDSQHTHICD